MLAALDSQIKVKPADCGWIGLKAKILRSYQAKYLADSVEDAFGGAYIWIVGSVLYREDWRDVDLRVEISDSEYGRLFTKTVNDVDGTIVGLLDQFRMLFQTAVNALLRQTTGLPIDFQVQSETEAKQYHGRKRQPITLRPYINPEFRPQWKDSREEWIPMEEAEKREWAK